MKDLQILLVEDSPSDVRLVREAIREAGASILLHVVRDGLEALNYLNTVDQGGTRRPDLILLDWNLPRKSGREVLAEIKSSAWLRNIPVLVLTSSNSEEDVWDAYSLNANSFITKPADLNSYLRMIRAVDTFWGSTATLSPQPRSYPRPAAPARRSMTA